MCGRHTERYPTPPGIVPLDHNDNEEDKDNNKDNRKDLDNDNNGDKDNSNKD